jgi:hypothetical protein
MMAGQVTVGDITCHNWHRDMGRIGTWHDEDWDAKACQGEDEDREAGNWG